MGKAHYVNSPAGGVEIFAVPTVVERFASFSGHSLCQPPSANPNAGCDIMALSSGSVLNELITLLIVVDDLKREREETLIEFFIPF